MMMTSMRSFYAAFLMLLAAITGGHAFFFAPPSGVVRQQSRATIICSMTLDDDEQASSSTTTSSTSSSSWDFSEWAIQNGMTISDKLKITEPHPDDRGKGGVIVASDESIKALEILATIPRDLILADAPTRAMEAAANAKNFSWAVDLTAAALVALHPSSDEDEEETKQQQQEWISSWKTGGWATDASDLGPPEANWGPKDVHGSLLATGTDNDYNIYAKFRMPCHPVVLRASMGLGVLTGCTEDEAREALTCRGRSYRSMRDALEPLVLNPSSARETGSNREKRCWDVADMLSRVLSRATTLQLEDDNDKALSSPAIVPLHERLAHSAVENTKLVTTINGDIALVATQDIAAGDQITRNYEAAPRLDQDETSHRALRLLLQFGLPPSAW